MHNFIVRNYQDSSVMTASYSKQRRSLLKFAATACISPSVLISQTGHASWPWLLRFLGLSAARKTAGRKVARKVNRSLSYRNAIPSAYDSAQVVSAINGSALLFGTSRTVLAAKAGLHKLMMHERDSMKVPQARVARSQVDAAHIPLLNIDKVRAVYLNVPPLAQSIHDKIAWGVVDVLHGEVTKIGKCPLMVRASAESGTLELPLGHFSTRGPHQFIAVLEEYAVSVPILSTSVIEVR